MKHSGALKFSVRGFPTDSLLLLFPVPGSLSNIFAQEWDTSSFMGCLGSLYFVVLCSWFVCGGYRLQGILHGIYSGTYPELRKCRV